MTAPVHGVKEFAVPSIYGESVRLTAWNMAGPLQAAPGGSLWLHLYDSADDPSNDPDDMGTPFFSGIALDSDAAMQLGVALQLAATRMQQATA